MSNSNDAMDTDNGLVYIDDDGQPRDLLFGFALAPTPNGDPNWTDGHNLLPEFDDRTYGAPLEADPSADNAIDEVVPPAHDATATVEQTEEEEQLPEDAGDNQQELAAAGSFWCTLCQVMIPFPTEQQWQAHMEHGQHLYLEDAPEQDAVTVLTRVFERMQDWIDAESRGRLSEYVEQGSSFQTPAMLSGPSALCSAGYYAAICALFDAQRPHAGPAERLVRLRAHDDWFWLYCNVILGRPPRCLFLALQYENALRQQGALIDDIDLGPIRYCIVDYPPVQHADQSLDLVQQQ